MALVGRFQADFQSFFDACQRAEVALRPIESGANKVGQSLNRMVDGFSGRKVITDAALMAEAVERIGGASKLTESEQRRVNATATEAIAKYAALGQQAPAAMTALADATKRVEAPTQAINAQMVSLGTAIGTFVGNIAYDAVRRLGSSIVTMVADGAKMTAIVTSFDRLTASIGETSDAMIGATRTATKGLISDLDIMQASNKAMLLGLPVSAKEMGTLSAAAVTLGKAMGLNATQSLNDLIVALGRSSPLILDNLGLTVKVGAANDAYAARLGKSAEQLTDVEKKTAFYNAAMEAAKVKTESLGGVQLNLVDQGTRVSATFANLLHGVGDLVNSGLAPLSFVLRAIPDEMVTVGVAVGGLVTGFVALKLAAAGVAAALATGMGAAAAATAAGALTTTVVGLGATVAFLASNPLGWAIAATAALTAAFLYLKNSITTDLTPAIKQAEDGLKGYSKAIEDLAAKPFTMSMEDVTRISQELTESVKKQIAETERLGKVREQAFGIDKVKSVRDMVAAIGGIAGVARMSADETAQFAIRLAEATSAAIRNGMKDLAAKFETLRQSIPLATKAALDFSVAMSAVAPTITSIADSVVGRLLPSVKGLDALYASSAGIKVANAELARMGMLLPEIVIENERVSESIEKTSVAATFMANSFSQLGPTIMAAMQGGGSAIKSLGSLFGGELTKSIFGREAMQKSITSLFGSTLGGAFNALLPGIGALAGPLISKIAGLFKGVFGASEKELAGRDVAAKFREELERTLTVTQKLEAGTDQWKKSVIAIRDAYIAHGRSGEEALVISERLWRAEKEGPEAVKRVIEEVAAVMSGTFANALVTTGMVAQETLAGVADAAVGEMNRIADSIKYYDRGTGQTGEDARRMSPGDARAAIDSFVAHGGSRAWAEAFLEANPGDEGRLESARFDYRPSENRPEDALTPAQMGFAGGTGGKYLDFGSGTNVVLHGREKVTTATQGQSEATAWAGMESRLRSIEQMLGRFPLQIRDAILLTR